MSDISLSLYFSSSRLTENLSLLGSLQVSEGKYSSVDTWFFSSLSFYSGSKFYESNKIKSPSLSSPDFNFEFSIPIFLKGSRSRFEESLKSSFGFVYISNETIGLSSSEILGMKGQIGVKSSFLEI